MRITEVQAQALATFVTRIRPEWRHPGVMAAIEKAQPTADVHDLACALIRLAEDKSVLTPGLLPSPGPHWTKPDGAKAPRRGDHSMRCPEHDERLPCATCKAGIGPPPAEDWDHIQKALEAAKTKNLRSDADQRAREEKKRS